MYDNPEIMRQLVNARLEQRRRQAAVGRVAGRTRRLRRHLHWLQTPRVTWFGRRGRAPGASEPVTA
ncbi:MAG TPA: hypothetical protein VIJ48_07850 [Acidimicrobiia bacterium]